MYPYDLGDGDLTMIEGELYLHLKNEHVDDDVLRTLAETIQDIIFDILIWDRQQRTIEPSRN